MTWPKKIAIVVLAVAIIWLALTGVQAAVWLSMLPTKIAFKICMFSVGATAALYAAHKANMLS